MCTHHPKEKFRRIVKQVPNGGERNLPRSTTCSGLPRLKSHFAILESKPPVMTANMEKNFKGKRTGFYFVSSLIKAPKSTLSFFLVGNRTE